MATGLSEEKRRRVLNLWGSSVFFSLSDLAHDMRYGLKYTVYHLGSFASQLLPVQLVCHTLLICRNTVDPNTDEGNETFRITPFHTL
jgi:hypothetical protein